jgi:hypothetical protein
MVEINKLVLVRGKSSCSHYIFPMAHPLLQRILSGKVVPVSNNQQNGRIVLGRRVRGDRAEICGNLQNISKYLKGER